MGPDSQVASADDQLPNPDWARIAKLVNGCAENATNNTTQATKGSSSLMASDIDELTCSQAKIREQSTEKALLLKKKELKWKLMQASQVQNKAKLNEIKTALVYHKRKLLRAQSLVARLRSKYVTVVKSAKLSEAQLEAAKAQLASQEKHVANEKMQLTRLALECIDAGTSLYGNSYKLPDNKTKNSAHEQSKLKPIYNQPHQRACDTKRATLDSEGDILNGLKPFLRTARTMANSRKNQSSASDSEESHNVIIEDIPLDTIRPKVVTKKPKRRFVSRLSSLYDLNDSILKDLASYRLTRDCSDKSCPYQHKSNYYMTDLEKLTDLLSYGPAAAGWVRDDDDLDEAENNRLCRIKLKQHSAKLISRNADKPVETIARAIVANDLRNNKPDIDLLLMRRQLPKMVHLKPRPNECSCEVIEVPEEPSDPPIEYVLFPVQPE